MGAWDVEHCGVRGGRYECSGNDTCNCPCGGCKETVISELRARIQIADQIDDMWRQAVERGIDEALAEVRRQGGPDYLLLEARGQGLREAASFVKSRRQYALELLEVEGLNVGRPITQETTLEAFINREAQAKDLSKKRDNGLRRVVYIFSKLKQKRPYKRFNVELSCGHKVIVDISVTLDSLVMCSTCRGRLQQERRSQKA